MTNDQTPNSLHDAALFRPVFVGRESELRGLQRDFDAAAAGRGNLVMVVGEPGIGKTAICEQLVSYVGGLGALALTGHCYEEGSLSLPYLPFVECLRNYVRSLSLDDLRELLGPDAADVARIVPEVRERLQIRPRPAANPETDRWRLLQAVSDFLCRIGGVRPLLLVLEDLHWADRGTLDLLVHLARNLQGARLLVAGTYRDIQVDRTHPLSSALAELSRVGHLPRVLLRGLTVDEVQVLYNEIRGQEIPRARAEVVHRQTEGNPLFVQEVLRYNIEARPVVQEEGRWLRTGDGGPWAGIPEGLRDVIGKRLSYLSDECNQMLSVSSVIGREFDFATLRLVVGWDEERLITAIEQAMQGGVLEDQSRPGVVRYRFTHALYSQTLYEEISAPRRLRFHQQIARALEAQFASHLEDHEAELAEHFSHSTDPADLAQAVQYSELAARRATAVFAYGEASRLLERALDVQAVLNPNDKLKRCDLLLALGEATLPMEEPRHVAETVAEEAFELAEAMGDSNRAAYAAMQACDALLRAGGPAPQSLSSREGQEWALRLDRHAHPSSKERIYGDIYLGLSTLAQSREAGHGYLRSAVQRAIELDENATSFLVFGWALNNLGALRDYHLVDHLADKVLALPQHSVRTRDLSMCLASSGRVLLERGERDRAEAVWRELDSLAERTLDATVSVATMGTKVLSTFIDGSLEEALSLIDSLRVSCQEAGVGWGGRNTASPLLGATILSYLGRPVDSILLELEGPTRAIQVSRAVTLALLGRCAEAKSICDGFGDIGSDEDETNWLHLVALLMSSILCREEDTLRALVARMAPLAICVPGVGPSVGRLLGEASVLLGQQEQARAYYAMALEVCEKMRFRPEIALIRLDLAELLLKRYPAERRAAHEHLDFVIGEFNTMGMSPSLARAMKLRGRRRPPVDKRPVPYPDGLSEREVQVLRLIAQGKTNREIADELVISINTVQRHTSNIFAKAGLANRAVAAAYAQRNALI